MNVIQFSQDNIFSTCGNTTVVNNLDSMFKSIGIKTYTFIDNRGIDNYKLTRGDKIIYHATGDEKKIFDYYKYVKNKIKPNILFFHDMHYPKFDYIVKNENTCKKVIFSHYLDPDIFQYEPYIDAIIAFHKTSYDFYKKSFKNKVFYLPHSTDENIFFNKNQNRYDNSFIYVGRIIRNKEVEGLFPYIKQYNLKYSIVGPQSDKDYISYLYSLIKKYNIQNNVTIYDKMSKYELNDILNKHKFFYLNSNFDCYNLSFQESLFCGLIGYIRNIDNSYTWVDDNYVVFHNKINNFNNDFEILNKKYNNVNKNNFFKIFSKVNVEKKLQNIVKNI